VQKLKNRIYFQKFISDDDFQYLLNLVSNEKVMIMNFRRAFQLEEAKKYYKRVLQNNEKHEDFGHFKVFEATTNTFIGMGELSINDNFTEAEIGYLLLPEYWGKGYGSESARELLTKAEETKSIRRVTATTDPNNIASKKILLNSGFVSCKIYKIDDGSSAEMFSKEIAHF